MPTTDELRQAMRVQRRKLHVVESLWLQWQAKRNRPKVIGTYPHVQAALDAIAQERIKLMQAKAALAAALHP